jgi:hypothetical protein
MPEPAHPPHSTTSNPTATRTLRITTPQRVLPVRNNSANSGLPERRSRLRGCRRHVLKSFRTPRKPIGYSQVPVSANADFAWAWIGTADPCRQLLIRRSLIPNANGVRELWLCLCLAPEHRSAALPALIKIAGRRWPVEKDLQVGKAAFDSTVLRPTPHYYATSYWQWPRSPWQPSPPPTRTTRSAHIYTDNSILGLIPLTVADV